MRTVAVFYPLRAAVGKPHGPRAVFTRPVPVAPRASSVVEHPDSNERIKICICRNREFSAQKTGNYRPINSDFSARNWTLMEFFVAAPNRRKRP